MGIFVNEVGYLRESTKRATVLEKGKYSLVNKENGELIYSKDAEYFGEDASSGDNCYIFDFSEVISEGLYYIKSDETGKKSASFAISDKVYNDLMTNLIKCFHYQRCGCELKEEHVGVYKHASCHTEKAMLFGDYIDKKVNPKMFDATMGWHDAGDYGKYISPAAVAIGHLLYAYELFSKKVSMDLNIPETGNGCPDILNEIRYELEWMFKMQNDDGGVYHKVTTLNHVAFMMPEEDKDQMLIFPVSSLATADFAACMALVSRVYKKYDEEFAQKALMASRAAYKWIENHDYVGFKNPTGSNTGEYGDITDEDERMWAAAELLRSDDAGDVNSYKQMLTKYLSSDVSKTDFGWIDVSGFALLSVLTDSKHSAGKDVEEIFLNALYQEADRLLEIMKNSGYDIAMKNEDFVWGSNMTVTNRGMLFVLAGKILLDNGDAKKYAGNRCEEYFKAAGAHVDYILGRNALGRSYVTGFGEHAFKNPHNRTSACDGIDDPMPGWVSGGPFKDFVDVTAKEVLKKGTPPQKCHADEVGSYSTNEITIYWNSSMIFLLAGIM